MDAFKKNLTDLGTKLKEGATDFAEKHDLEEKIQDLKTKTEGVLSAKTTDELSTTSKTEKPSFVSKIAYNITPEFKTPTEGSIADMLMKAKAKAFESSTGKEEVQDAPTTTPDTTAAEPPANESYPGDVAMKEIQKECNEIAAKMEALGKEIAENEEVQKVMVPLLTKLSLAQARFEAASSKSAGEKEQPSTTSEENEQAPETTTTISTEESSNEGEKASHYAVNDLKYQAEKAAKKALEDAEAIAKSIAIKTGILDDKTEAVANADDGASTQPPAENKKDSPAE